MEDDGDFVSLSRNRAGQKVFGEIVFQSLNDLEYEDEYAARWRPRKFPDVVIDPSRFFGEPILDDFGVSTKTLHDEYAAFGDAKYLSKIYEIPISKINVGLRFEKEARRKAMVNVLLDHNMPPCIARSLHAIISLDGHSAFPLRERFSIRISDIEYFDQLDRSWIVISKDLQNSRKKAERAAILRKSNCGLLPITGSPKEARRTTSSRNPLAMARHGGSKGKKRKRPASLHCLT